MVEEKEQETWMMNNLAKVIAPPQEKELKAIAPSKRTAAKVALFYVHTSH